MLTAWYQDTDENAYKNHEHFPALHCTCQNKQTENSDQTAHSTFPLIFEKPK